MDAKVRDLIEAVIAVDDYRAFLSALFEALGKQSRTGRFNHSSFARKAGLRSRGFAQEVVSGRKRLTSQSYSKFVKAMDLPARAENLFHLLVIREEPEMNDEELTDKQIQSQIEIARTRLKADLQSSHAAPMLSRSVSRHRHVLTVYATLGNQKTGVSFDQILKRTGLQPAVVKRIIDHLLANQLANETDGRYRSMNSHLVFQGLGGDHPAKDAYLDTLSELQKVAKEKFSDADKTFIHSHVSLNPKKLGILKKRLWEVVLAFIDECDDDDGEAVGKLVVGFYV